MILRNRYTKKIISLTFLVIITLPLISITLYNHPSADDYDYANWSSFFPKYLHWYNGWSGRYFSNFILMINPIHWHSFLGYKITSLLFVLLFLLGFLAFLNYLCELLKINDKKLKIIFCLSSVFVFFNNLPSLVEGFYWYPGSMTYMLPSLLYLMLFILIFKRERREEIGGSKRQNFLYSFITALLTVLIIGGNETIMFYLMISLFSYTFYCILTKKHYMVRHLVVLLFIGAFCSLIVILAPGNVVRMSYLSNDKLVSLFQCLRYTIQFIVSNIVNPIFFLYSFLMFLISFKVGRDSNIDIKPINYLDCFYIVGFSVFVASFPAFFSAGSIAGRTTNFVFLIFQLSWIYFIYSLSFYIANVFSKVDLRKYSSLLYFLIMIIFLITLSTATVSKSNYARISHDFLLGKFRAYDLEMKNRYSIIRNSVSPKVQVPRIKNVTVLFFRDITDDSTKWPNTSYESYWGKESIVLQSRNDKHNNQQ